MMDPTVAAAIPSRGRISKYHEEQLKVDAQYENMSEELHQHECIEKRAENAQDIMPIL